MHIKNIHCMIEKLAEYCKCDIEKGYEQLDVNVVGDAVDMIKDLCEAEYYARIAKAMEKEEEEDKEEEKYLLKMLKEEHEDEYKRMREKYGEDEGERRFYDNYRHANGRFARKGTGSYRPRSSGRRRGYEEPPYLHMPYDFRDGMDEYGYDEAERMRDLDRTKGRIYFSEPMSGRTMSDGYSDRTGGDMGSSHMRDGREGRSGQSRRSYMETKEANKGNSPQEKQEKMKELEKYMGELGGDITEMISDASPEERALLKQKMQVLVQKLG